MATHYPHTRTVRGEQSWNALDSFVSPSADPAIASMRAQEPPITGAQYCPDASNVRVMIALYASGLRARTHARTHAEQGCK